MKLKLELDEKKYEGDVEEIIDVSKNYYLIQAHNEPEVFVVIDRVKHWVQNPETAQALEYDLSTRTIMSLDKVNYFITGDTFNMIDEPERARDIYYPEPEKPYPFKGLRGLLTLNPVPSGQLVKDLGFNAIMQYTNVTPGWNRDLITTWIDDKTILRFTGDEPDCRSEDPDKVFQKYVDMKNESPDIPVGLNLCSDIGCGREGTCGSVKEYQKKWIEIANKIDYVSINIYPYRSDWPDPIAKMERFYNFWKDNISVPIIPVIQAHWITDGLTQPNPSEQVKFWVNKGLTGYIVYCWTDENKGVRDMQGEWKAVNGWGKNNI